MPKSQSEVSVVGEAERAASVSDRSFGSIRVLTVAARQDEPLPRLTSLWNLGPADLAVKSRGQESSKILVNRSPPLALLERPPVLARCLHRGFLALLMR
jgi:hypothetical protein